MCGDAADIISVEFFSVVMVFSIIFFFSDHLVLKQAQMIPSNSRLNVENIESVNVHNPKTAIVKLTLKIVLTSKIQIVKFKNSENKVLSLFYRVSDDQSSLKLHVCFISYILSDALIQTLRS